MPGIVASGHPNTSAAAAEILTDGGNAFDAAIAGLLTACVTEPLLASLGGGGFLIGEMPDGQRRLFDFFGQTPGRQRPDAEIYPIEGDFGAARQRFHIGSGSIAVPGMAQGLFDVHAALGRLPFARLAEAAVRRARDGVEINAFQARVGLILEPIVRAGPEVEALFTRDGQLLQPGERQFHPEMADTLDTLAREGPRWFYQGEPCAGIVRLCSEQGGHLTRDDLARYHCIEREPLTVRYRRHRIHTNPVPSSGGTLIGHSLRLLDGLRGQRWRTDPRELQRVLPRVMEATNVERLRSGLQRETSDEAAERLLGDPAIDALVALLDDHRPAWRGTTHLSVVDGDGAVVATTVSNGEGCGQLVAGVHLNNFLGEDDLLPDGIGRWQPDRRLSSMMAPTLVDTSDGARIALGSGGSNRLRTAIAQVLVQMLELGCDPETAVDAPRMHLEGDGLNLEPGFDSGLVETLAAEYPNLIQWDQPSLFFGGVHVARIDAAGRLDGAGDRRRGGCVVQF